MRSYKEHHRGGLQLAVTFLEMNWVLQRQQEKVGKRWNTSQNSEDECQAERAETEVAMMLTSMNRER